ncbi:MAG: glycerol-3-phosphate dehydrogenase/oxidase [Desulfobacula sp.]|nr:glycerol-3-phosphate dehydrogenase/oxidase [Desulfobacula sp.]
MKASDFEPVYDLVIAGGGITGAGVFHEAVKRGYKVLLVEAKDFAWGTSSRSSKMVHGGLRYLKQGKFLMTKAAVKEREYLLESYNGLVTPLQFIMPLFDDSGPSRSAMKIGLSIYSFMAGKKQHENFSKQETLNQLPWIRKEHLLSAVGFKDAQVDDARLVLRLIEDAGNKGGCALNYTRVTQVVRDGKGSLTAVKIKNHSDRKDVEIKTNVLVNATGAFAEQLHPSPEKGLHIRPLRGSHLIFPGHLLSLDRVISFFHPKDLRPIFIFPWEGCIVLGTTDVDHNQNIETEPFVTTQEAAYLMDGLNHVLPQIPLSLNECISSIAGVRPVLSKIKRSASSESREHVIWKNKGLITVTGGKLTTFRLLAYDALRAAGKLLPKKIKDNNKACKKEVPVAKTMDEMMNKNSVGIPEDCYNRLVSIYGTDAAKRLNQYDKNLFVPIENTSHLWVELCYAVQYEKVVHLSDLLLRRVRIGLFLRDGGKEILDKVESVCKSYLPWDGTRWEKEKKTYIENWEQCYSPPVISG